MLVNKSTTIHPADWLDCQKEVKLPSTALAEECFPLEEDATVDAPTDKFPFLTSRISVPDLAKEKLSPYFSRE